MTQAIVTVPRWASDGLLASMATRMRHDFGLLDEATQRVILSDMRKVHEEVVGTGFYQVAPSTVVTVPLEPTDEMLACAFLALAELYRGDGGWIGEKVAHEQARRTWKAMLSAAPSPAVAEAEWITALRKELSLAPMKSNFTLSRDEMLEIFGGAFAVLKSVGELQNLRDSKATTQAEAKDAARYRWLRYNSAYIIRCALWDDVSKMEHKDADLDEHIDAAMAADKERT